MFGQQTPSYELVRQCFNQALRNQNRGVWLCRTMTRASHRSVEVLEGCLGDAAKLQQMPPQAPRSRRRLTASWWMQSLLAKRYATLLQLTSVSLSVQLSTAGTIAYSSETWSDLIHDNREAWIAQSCAAV